MVTEVAEQSRPVQGSDQLKDAIDRGQTGDKVVGYDPGAATLGTDEEAGNGNGYKETAVREAVPDRSSGPAVDQAADPAGNDRDAYSRQDVLIVPVTAATVLVLAIALLAASGFTG